VCKHSGRNVLCAWGWRRRIKCSIKVKLDTVSRLVGQRGKQTNVQKVSFACIINSILTNLDLGLELKLYLI
jgi:hypothetical protein